MQMTHSKVLTILAEHMFETQLIELIERAGASGYYAEVMNWAEPRHG